MPGGDLQRREVVGGDRNLVGAQDAGQIGQRGHAALAGIVASGCSTDTATGCLTAYSTRLLPSTGDSDAIDEPRSSGAAR